MIAEQLKANVVEYLTNNLLHFPAVEDQSSDQIGMPRCVVEVIEEGEEIIGYTARFSVTATLYIEAAMEGAKGVLTTGIHDLDISMTSDLFRQGCSGEGVVIDGVVAGPTASDLNGEVWTRSRNVTAFVHA